jgi:ligand-binding sensor domain-containing protein
MKIINSILLILILSVPALSQQEATNWKTYSAMNEINAISSYGSNIWAATTGGGFAYNAAADSFATYHKTEGLQGVLLTALTVDQYGKVWFGSSDGIIDVYFPSTGTFKQILDIYSSNQTNKQINELKVSGDTIMVSTDFGISLIDAKNLVFYDTFLKLGSFSSNIQVNSTLKSGLIYACTGAGIAVQKAGAENLSAPESWSNFTTADGLPSNNVLKIISFQGSVIAATDNGLAEFNGTTWINFAPQLNGKSVTDAIAVGDSMFFVASNTIYKYSNGNVKVLASPSVQVNCLTYSNKLGLAAGTNNGILPVEDSAATLLAPNGPLANQFPDMSVDNNGILWSASGRDVTGIGFYSFNGTKWTNYSVSLDPDLPSNAYHVAYSASDNSTYLGSWGEGFIRIKNGVIEDFSAASTGMKGNNNNPDFLVISGFATDSQNDLWVLNYGAIDENALSMLTPDSVWYHFHVPAMGNSFVYDCYNLAIDQYDTKWFSSLDNTREGLFYFNENNTFSNTSDDISGYLTTANGLLSNSISAVVVDQMGDVWVGTNIGVNIITNTQALVYDNNPSELVISSIFGLRQQTVNCIAVDPLNRKWIGTNNGLILINSDGTSILADYNSANSPLLSDQVNSIAIDKNSGKIYVGTDEGINSFQTDAIQPKDSFTKLFVYPSPFLVTKGATNKLTIDGLIRNSSIKIISISGRLIKEFDSAGGRVAFWDGTDQNGNLVSSGIYLIVAYDQDGNSVTTGKIAVLNK